MFLLGSDPLGLLFGSALDGGGSGSGSGLAVERCGSAIKATMSNDCVDCCGAVV